MYYSTPEVLETKNSTLALFDLEGVSLIHCGSRCLAEHCCKEFMYNKGSMRCLGIQFEDFDSTGNTNLIITSNEGMSTYRQEGCETGWLEFKGHCYHKGHNKGNWSEAKTECRNMCSYLIEIESKEEADWISATYLENVNCLSLLWDCTAWTGLNDIDIEGSYVWDHSNAPISFSNWHPREPSLYNRSHALTKDCIDILRGGIWNDRPCSYLNWVICEKSL
uniref:Low affinity immunoglobulin epsilon Fc receptor-like n=1 Tax=Crassostrea virginica TaxID=6565 RepID=A0A8B8C8C3_CRAVI|nr:low affinity immunoglobulin epsilon Fc receptor-like [Crassostrea virginica]